MARMPPLKAIVAFDAAMQHKSFALAADALSVTPSAVGQQIQRLEGWLGLILFVRKVRAVEPTPAAVSYWQEIRPALETIRRVSNTVRHGGGQELCISMPPTFAAKWFSSRMPRFVERHPGITLRVSASTVLSSVASGGVDLAIRHYDGAADPGLLATLLSHDHIKAYCAPEYSRRLPLVTPRDLRAATLLHTTLHPHWSQWLAHCAGLSGAEAEAIKGLHFDQTLLAIEAARRGRGLVLCSPILVEEEVAEGSLHEAFPCVLKLPKSYYLIEPRATPLRPVAELLKAWILEEFNKTAH